MDAYLLKDWRWNEGRYGVQRALTDMVDVLNKVCICIPTVNRAGPYKSCLGNDVNRQCHEEQIEQLQPGEGVINANAAEEDVRDPLLPFFVPLTLCRGNLSVRSLVDIVRKEHFIGDSEYMQTVLLAIPKYAAIRDAFSDSVRNEFICSSSC